MQSLRRSQGLVSLALLFAFFLPLLLSAVPLSARSAEAQLLAALGQNICAQMTGEEGAPGNEPANGTNGHQCCLAGAICAALAKPAEADWQALAFVPVERFSLVAVLQAGGIDDFRSLRGHFYRQGPPSFQA